MSNLHFAIAGEIAPFLADIHTENHEHGKQSQGKEKCHSYSVYLCPSYTQLMKMHLRTG